MREGYWINYQNGKTFEVPEHEVWIRDSKNAKALGVSRSVIAMFGNFKPVVDRDKFLLFIVQHAPVMRVRGHGQNISFEYSSREKSGPMDEIWLWGKKNAGPFTQISIVNFATKEQIAMFFQDFEDAMDKGGYDAVMRVAGTSRFSINARLAKELLKISKDLL